MSHRITFEERLCRHNRDLDLFGQLFATWTKGRTQIAAEANQRLDAIEAQLARLERTVTMATPAVRPARPVTDRPDSRRATMPLAAQHI